MITQKMKLYRVKDDVDELKTELMIINEQSKRTYVELRRDKEGGAQ